MHILWLAVGGAGCLTDVTKVKKGKREEIGDEEKIWYGLI